MNKHLVRRLCKICSLFLLLAGGLTLFHFADLHAVTDVQWADAHIRDQGIYGCLLYMGLVALLTSVSVPRQITSFIGGYVFGALLGTLWGTLGTLLGCVVMFLYARFIGQGFIQRRFGKRIAKVNDFLGHDPLTMTLVIRFMPVGSNVLTNLLAGVSSIPALKFFIGSGLGYLPQNFIFALLGSGVRVSPLWRTVCSALLFGFSTAFGFWLYKKYKNAPVTDDAQDGVDYEEKQS